ncbi:MAG: hypothetical protein LAT65_10100 [Saccharospirillum sp.]|nr:hypothetical protein [Saccharospirillum sp.]
MTVLRPFLRLWLSLLALTVAMPALGHGLNVFASVEGETLIVESKFSSGRVPQVGTVRIYDGYDVLVHETEVTGESAMRLPLPDWSTGLKVEVDIGDGHDGYWILTPADVRRQQAEPES